jgi:hypothetical protein
MQKIKLIVFLLYMLFTPPLYAQNASTYVDTVLFTKSGTEQQKAYVSHNQGDVNMLDDGEDFVMWTHHLSSKMPTPAKITKGTLTITLKDDSDIPLEYFFAFSEDFRFDYDKFHETFSYDVDVAYLEDGAFTVKLLSLMGDFFIVQSELAVEYVPK